jgi:hypothetical protein
MLARLIAVVIHEVREELRKLDEPPTGEPQDAHRYDPASTTAGETERAGSWDHDKAPPVTAFGFGVPGARPNCKCSLVPLRAP